jgi:rhodanese-related sulfurtransferase
MNQYKRITANELGQRMGDGNVDANGVHLVDVRDYDEFQAVHVTGAEWVPLPNLMNQASQWDPSKPVYVVCQMGIRSEKAAEQLAAAGFTDVSMVEGGTKRCAKEGLPVVRGPRKLPVQRQTFIVIGCMILTGLIGSYWYAPLIALAWLAGLGLIMAGVTGFCGMAVLIGKLPWNRQPAAPTPTGAACSSGEAGPACGCS